MLQNTWQAVELSSFLDNAAQHTTRSQCWRAPWGLHFSRAVRGWLLHFYITP